MKSTEFEIFNDEFKEALKILPNKEKDKLILRLLRSNTKLAIRLRFELIDTETVETKRNKLADELKERILRYSEYAYSPGILLVYLREISGFINSHVYTTKDKYGEITLNCLMLNEALKLNNDKILKFEYKRAITLCEYYCSRIFKILILISKTHDDLHLEFKDDVVELGTLFGQNPFLMKTAIHNGLDINLLIHFNIPKNIEEIYKNLK